MPEDKNLNEIIFNYAPVGVAVISKGGVFESVNEKFLEIHGGKKDDFIGSSALEFPFYKKEGLDKFINGALSGKKFYTEISFVSLAGAKESFRKYLGIPSSGKIVLMVQDVTEQRRMEGDTHDYVQKIKEEQSQLLASINSLPLGFIIIDLKNNLLIENEATDRILGLPQLEGADVFLKGDVSLIEEKLKGSFDLRTNYEKCISEKMAINFKEVAFENKFLRILLAPILSAKGAQQEIIGVAILMEDITEAKVIERSREEFFAIASHELRTPLTAIRGNASLIEEFYSEKINDKEVSQMITDIKDASVRLIGIVNDFLDISRLEQNKMEFKKENFDVVVLIQDTVRELEKVAVQKNLYLKAEEYDPSPPMIVADKNKTKQILVNLIGNAVNYTREGGVSIKAEKENNFLKICISDTGVGISPENQNLLFRKFQQAGEKILTRDMTKSTGLGLYISKLMVESMGGTIGLAKSEPNKGSVFFFALPIVS